MPIGSLQNGMEAAGGGYLGGCGPFRGNWIEAAVEGGSVCFCFAVFTNLFLTGGCGGFGLSMNCIGPLVAETVGGRGRIVGGRTNCGFVCSRCAATLGLLDSFATAGDSDFVCTDCACGRAMLSRALPCGSQGIGAATGCSRGSRETVGRGLLLWLPRTSELAHLRATLLRKRPGMCWAFVGCVAEPDSKGGVIGSERGVIGCSWGAGSPTGGVFGAAARFVLRLRRPCCCISWYCAAATTACWSAICAARTSASADMRVVAAAAAVAEAKWRARSSQH